MKRERRTVVDFFTLLTVCKVAFNKELCTSIRILLAIRTESYIHGPAAVADEGRKKKVIRMRKDCGNELRNRVLDVLCLPSPPPPYKTP